MESSGPTILAIANDDTRTFLIDAAEKRIVFKKLRRRYRKQAASMPGIRLFAYAAAILVALVPEDDTVVIDMEYMGHERHMRQIIVHQLRRLRKSRSEQNVQFHQIGKAARAHSAAIAVYRGQREAGTN